MTELLPRSVLFVDDEKPILTALERNLIREPFRKFFANSAREGLEILARESVQVVVSDMRMPEMDGLTFLRQVRERYPDAVRMVLSGTSEISRVIEAINSGEVYRYLTKPLNELAEFRATLRQAFEYNELQQSRRTLIAELEQNNKILSRWRERITHELEVAAQVQQRILATKPILGMEYSVHFAYQPCLSIGGDFFDAIAWPDGRLCVYIGDVAGHGVGSAMLSTLLKVTASDLIRAHGAEGPAAICRRFNSFLLEHIQNDEFFATFFIAFHDPKTHLWRACNCGHPPPLLLDENGRSHAEFTQDTGDMPLGIVPTARYCPSDVEISWPAHPGDILLLFTDGLTEARHRNTGIECGDDHLAAIASEMAAPNQPLLRPSDLLARLETDGYDLSEDDCCAIAVRLIPAHEKLLETSMAPTLASVDAVATQTEKLLQEAGWPKEAATIARLVVMEYAVNIVRYGHLQPADSIDFQLARRGPYAYLLFRDPGRQWDYADALARARNAPPDAEGGRGLMMMTTLANKLDIFRYRDHNFGSFVLTREPSP